MTDTLVSTLQSLVDPGVVLASETVRDDAGVFAEERRFVEKAVPKRVNEFAAGRRAARRALASFGLEGAAIPAGADRAPIWPEGVTGSITHDDHVALAAVARAEDVTSIGLDVTDAAALPGGVRDRILRHPIERGVSDLEARAVFSAKESLFKAISAEVGFVFGFSAAVVVLGLEQGVFQATLSHSLGSLEAGRCWEGRIAVAEGRIATVLVIPNGGA